MSDEWQDLLRRLINHYGAQNGNARFDALVREKSTDLLAWRKLGLTKRDNRPLK